MFESSIIVLPFLQRLFFFHSGHGTWLDEEERISATVAGTVERINKLYSVRPLRSR